MIGRPLEEPAQIMAVGIQGPAAAAGQERDSGKLCRSLLAAVAAGLAMLGVLVASAIRPT